MKHFKQIIRLLLLAVVIMACNDVFAFGLPRMKDSYVNDFSGTLTTSELNQLRKDVKSMCDYYSTQIVVCMVSTFDDYDIEEYAEKIGSKWKVTKENGMLILVKPKSNEERGEAMILTSPDLEEVFSADVCQEIVSENMIPYFRQDDYYGGIEAVLEYLNNMSDEEEEGDVVAMASDIKNSVKSKVKGGFLSDSIAGLGIAVKWIIKGFLWLIGIGIIIALVAIVVHFINRQKKQQNNTTTSSRFNMVPFSDANNFDSDADDDSDDSSSAISRKKADIIRKKAELEELRKLEKEQESLNREYEKRKRRYERQELDEDDEYDDDNDNILKKIKDIQGLTAGSSEKSSSTLGKMAKGAAVVGGALLAGKLIKDAADKHDDDDEEDDGLMNKMGSIFDRKNKKSKTSAKPKLGGGSSSSSNSGKPRLGGGSKSSKPKLGGGSGKGSW